MLNNIRITQRFITIVVLYAVAYAIVMAVSLWGLMSARDSLRNVSEGSMMHTLRGGVSIEKITQNRLQVLLAFQHAPEGPLASVHNHPVTTHVEAVAANQAEADRLFKLMDDVTTDPEEKALLATSQATRLAWHEKLNQTVNAIKAGDFSPETMAAFLKAGREEGEAAMKAMNAFQDFQVKEVVSLVAAAESEYHRAMLVFALVIVLCGLPASWLIYSLWKRLRLGFQIADESATAIAGGDLSNEVHLAGSDEIGHLMTQMEKMRLGLHRVISQVRNGSDSIATAAHEVATGTQDLSNRTEQQASSLEQTASASEELASTVQNNAENAVQASQLAVSASDIAIRGGAVVSQVVHTMDAINTSSRKIVDIISVIDGIAFQTNILALNAAVEAARAGEQGRGFAVVASEVRSLAQRSAEAAKEIKTLITDSVEKVGVGTNQVAQAGATMQEIVTGIKSVADIVGEIASASREQSAGISQINQSVTQLDTVTQQNAALVEETSAASSALQEQANELAKLAASFKLETSAGGRSALLQLR
jgi:methyl-accepting chemotaxis protein